jgi:hypothetical protein
VFGELMRPFLRWLFWNRWRVAGVLAGVLLLIALAARFLAGGSGHPAGGAAGLPGPPSSAPPSAAAPQASASVPATSSPAAALPAAAATVNIYSWLPFTQRDLAAAAAVTARFGVDYDTFTYRQSAAAYVATMNGVITGPLATTLKAAYSDPGVAGLRTSQRQVSTGTATITSLRAFGPSSITFNVTARQQITGAGGVTTASTQYAVTVTGSGASWLVNDIELASAGNT